MANIKNSSMWFSCLDTNMNYVNTNRIKNFIYMYNIQNTEDNFKKLEHVIEKKRFYYIQTDFIYGW